MLAISYLGLQACISFSRCQTQVAHFCLPCLHKNALAEMMHKDAPMMSKEK